MALAGGGAAFFQVQVGHDQDALRRPVERAFRFQVEQVVLQVERGGVHPGAGCRMNEAGSRARQGRVGLGGINRRMRRSALGVFPGARLPYHPACMLPAGR